MLKDGLSLAENSSKTTPEFIKHGHVCKDVVGIWNCAVFSALIVRVAGDYRQNNNRQNNNRQDNNRQTITAKQKPPIQQPPNNICNAK